MIEQTGYYASPSSRFLADVYDAVERLQILLREKRDEHNELGTYGPDIHAAFSAGGFYRLLQPRKYGGYEASLAEFYRIMMLISEAHPSLGWNLTLASSHAYLIASHWPESVQEELFTGSEQFIAAHKAYPAGNCRKVAGGYILDGIFSYCSGVTYASHVILNAICPFPDGSEQSLNLIVPRADYTILDNWGRKQTLGMWASGSNSIQLDSVFVPDRMVAPFPGFYADQDVSTGTPGTSLHNNPMYLGYLMASYHANLLAPIIGAARAAIAEYHRINRTLSADPTVFPRVLGQSALLSNSAESLLFKVLESQERRCQAWENQPAPVSVIENLSFWGQLQHAGSLACECIELLFRNAGSSASYHGSRLLEYFNDAQMYRGHIGSQKEHMALYVGRAMLGQPTGFLGL